MNENLKDILQNGEEKYSHQAWEQLSKRLDTVMPVSKSVFLSTKGLLIAGASALFVGSGIFLLMNQQQENESSSKTTISVSLDSKEENKINETSTSFPKNTQPNQKEKNKIVQQEQVEHKKQYEENQDPVFGVPSRWEIADETFENPDLSKSNEPNTIKDNVIHFPKCNATYCMNEAISLTNDNKKSISLVNKSGTLRLDIPAGKTEKIVLTEDGEYYFTSALHPDEKAFSVFHTEEIDFSFENQVLYDEGVPYIQVNADIQHPNWSSTKGYFTTQEQESKFVAFKKGNYELTLSTRDQNNCLVSKTQEVSIKKDYDLMAQTGIDPYNPDMEVARFMPRAILLRNLSFEMQIIDPNTSAVIFRTKDASIPWDGMNHNTGQFVGYFTSFIWKVSISNPLPGEQSEYMGSIAVIQTKR